MIGPIPTVHDICRYIYKAHLSKMATTPRLRLSATRVPEQHGGRQLGFSLKTRQNRIAG